MNPGEAHPLIDLQTDQLCLGLKQELLLARGQRRRTQAQHAAVAGLDQEQRRADRVLAPVPGRDRGERHSPREWQEPLLDGSLPLDLYPRQGRLAGWIRAEPQRVQHVGAAL